MSWSYRITALYLGFVGIIVTLVVISSRQKIELEAKDYYLQELRYQEKLDAIKNTNELKTSLTHRVDKNEIVLTMPLEQVITDLKGEIYFFCPATSENDVKIKMQFDHNGQQIVKKSLLKPGAYKMRMSWSAQNKKYFKEEVINIMK